MRSLVKKAKIVGELESPCCTPDDTGNQSVNKPLSFSHAHRFPHTICDAILSDSILVEAGENTASGHVKHMTIFSMQIKIWSWETYFGHHL